MRAMDRIDIRNLEVVAKHGVYPEEKTLGQRFVISVSLYLDLRKAGKSDDLSDSLDYSKLCEVIEDFVRSNSFNLIETVAERLATKLLTEYAVVGEVRVEVKKPWAPINARLETVSVVIERGWHKVHVAIGSNIGDREGYFNLAVDEICGSAYVRNPVESGRFITKPYGGVKQEDFLNGCLEFETLYTPFETLCFLQDIEAKSGREKLMRWGPRTLDLDIIFYDDIVMSEDGLRIPHADMHNRDFVLEPLCQIAPYKLHPVLNKTVLELLADLRSEN